MQAATWRAAHAVTAVRDSKKARSRESLLVDILCAVGVTPDEIGVAVVIWLGNDGTIQ